MLFVAEKIARSTGVWHGGLEEACEQTKNICVSTCVFETHATHVHVDYRALLQHGAVQVGGHPTESGSRHRGH